MLGCLVLCLALVVSPVRAQAPTGPLVGVWYAGPGAPAPATALTDSEAIVRDLQRIRRSGFNAVTTWIPWTDAEPRRGALRLEPVEQLIAAAAAQELHVTVRILTSPGPAWAAGDGAAADQFVRAVSSRIGRAPAVWMIDVVKDAVPPPGLIRVGPGAASLAQARLAFWAAIARAESSVAFASSAGGIAGDLLALGETAGVVTRNEALFAPLRPRSEGVREVSGSGGAPVDVRLLESPQALMIIAINRAAAPRKVRIQFAPDIPEAIWQNLETGAAVNFVMGKTGPFLDHAFAAHDVVVLMIRKTLR